MSEDTLHHPSAEELRALSVGQLTEAELARVSAHLGQCLECCRRIDQLTADDPLLALENVTLTAHAAFMTQEATMRMLRTAIDLAVAAGA